MQKLSQKHIIINRSIQQTACCSQKQSSQCMHDGDSYRHLSSLFHSQISSVNTKKTLNLFRKEPENKSKNIILSLNLLMQFQGRNFFKVFLSAVIINQGFLSLKLREILFTYPTTAEKQEQISTHSTISRKTFICRLLCMSGKTSHSLDDNNNYNYCLVIAE